MVKMWMVGGKFGNKSKNTSVYGTGKILRGRASLTDTRDVLRLVWPFDDIVQN